jgi:hypothetical protein
MPLHFGPRVDSLVIGEEFLQSDSVLFSFLEMLCEAGFKLFVRGGFNHLRQCLDDLLFRAVEIFEFVDEEVFEGLKFHTRHFARALKRGCKGMSWVDLR